MRRIWNQSGRGGFVILLADRPLGEKRVSRGLSIVAVILCGLVALPLLYVDSLAKDALESGASESFGTKTTLGSVSLGLVSGKVGLAKLRVRNPEGFDARYFFSIRKGRFAVGRRFVARFAGLATWASWTWTEPSCSVSAATRSSCFS